MKFTAAILASLYLFIALHSAMTVLHFNINQQEIKTELCKYKDMTIPLCGGGVCYLQDQLSLSFDTDSTDENKTSNNSIVFELKQLLHTSPALAAINAPTTNQYNSIINTIPCFIGDNHSRLSAPPPRIM